MKKPAGSLTIESFGEISIAGRRAENQDRLRRFHSAFGEILVLADGVGGHRGGALAAELAVTRFEFHLRNPDWALDCGEALQGAARCVNREIYEQGAAQMGTTLAVAAIRLGADEPELRVGHAGDSRVYLWRRGHLQRLTKDHTVAAQLVEYGLLKPADAAIHPETHVLTRALGTSRDVRFDMGEPLPLEAGDSVMLCSDGLSGAVDEAGISKILSQSGDAEVAARQLTESALANGGEDNISVLLVKLGEAAGGVETGATIGDYRLERKLGEGGMGQVWLGRHEKLGSLAAIKLMLPGLGADDKMRSRFLREGQEQAKLNHHPALIRVLGYGEKPFAYLVLDYVDGESLKQRLERLENEPLELEEFAAISFRILDALAAAHAEKLVHRDVKSSNILLDRNGQAFLGDFGLVRSLDGAGLTEAGKPLGTSDYMSPEQILSPDKVDGRSDIYNFGCVLYEMLTGRTPFGFLGPEAVRIAQVANKPEPVRKLNPKVPETVENVVLRALEKDPAGARWQSCEELRDALRAALAGEDAAGWRWRLWRGVRAHAGLLVTVAGIMLLCGASLLFLNRLNLSKQVEFADELAGASEREQLRGDRNLAALLALEALKVSHTMRSRDQLLHALDGMSVPVSFIDERTGEPAPSYTQQQLVRILSQNAEALESLDPQGSHRVVEALSWSPGGDRLAAITPALEAKIWSVKDGKAIRKLTGCLDMHCGVAWNPKNDTVAAWSGYEVTIWDAASGVRVRTIAAKGQVTWAAWSPDGQSIAYSYGREIHAIVASTGIGIHDLATTDPVLRLDWNARAVVALFRDGLSWWRTSDWTSGPALHIGWKLTPDQALRVAISPDGLRFAFGDYSDGVHIRTFGNGEVFYEFILPNTQGVYRLSWSPKGDRLAMLDPKRELVWDVHPGAAPSLLYDLPARSEHRDSRIRWSSSGRLIALEKDGQIRIHSFDSGSIVKSMHLGETVENLAFLPDGSLAMAGRPNDFALWDPPHGTVQYLAGDFPGWNGFSKNGRGYIRRDVPLPGSFSLFEMQTAKRMLSTPGRVTPEWKTEARTFAVAACSPDGRKLVTAIRGLWGFEVKNAGTGESLQTFHLSQIDGCDSATFSTDGTRILCNGAPTRILDVATGRIVELQADKATDRATLAWSADSSRIAFASGDQGVSIWNTATGRRERILTAGSVSSLAWSLDGRQLAAGENSGEVRIIDPSNGSLLRTIRAHESAVQSLAWSSDGRLATGSKVDGIVKLWVLDEAAIEQHACGYIERNMTAQEWASYFGGRPYQPACAGK